MKKEQHVSAVRSGDNKDPFLCKMFLAQFQLKGLDSGLGLDCRVLKMFDWIEEWTVNS